MIYLHTFGAEITKVQQLFNENNERANRVIIRCERLISQLNNNKQAEITAHAFEKLSKLRSSKGSRYSDSSFRTSNDSDISEKQSLLAIQNENKPTSLELLKMKQKLEEAEAVEQFKQTKEKRSLVAITPVRHSELE